jgi:hypothetical protein
MRADHLAAHGVKAEHISDWTNTGDLPQSRRCSPASTLRTPISSSLGPSAVRGFHEGLFGGVSMDLMHQESLPVPMSH